MTHGHFLPRRPGAPLHRRTPLILSVLLSALASLAGGCGGGGPIPTSGTQGLPPEKLATVYVNRHGCVHEWNGDAVHIEKFYVGGVGYRVGDAEQAFLVSPGRHTFGVEYERCIHGTAVAIDPTEGHVFVGPYAQFEAVIDPAAQYDLTGSSTLTGKDAIQTVHSLRRRAEVPAK